MDIFATMTPCLLIVLGLNACQSVLCQCLQKCFSKTESFLRFLAVNRLNAAVWQSWLSNFTATQRLALKAFTAWHTHHVHSCIPYKQSDTLLTSPTFQTFNCQQYHICSVYYCIHDPHSLYVSWANTYFPELCANLQKDFCPIQRKNWK